MKKLEKKSFEVSSKGSGTEDSNEESNHSEESDDDRKAKKDRSLCSMFVEHIQNLIANAVKAHLEVGSHKTHCYNKPYTKRIDACLLYTSPSPRDGLLSRMPSSA